MEIAERLQELRKKAGYSQEQVAEMLGLSRQAISKWESGVSLRERFHTNPPLAFAQPLQPAGWTTRKGARRPVER